MEREIRLSCRYSFVNKGVFMVKKIGFKLLAFIQIEPYDFCDTQKKRDRGKESYAIRTKIASKEQERRSLWYPRQGSNLRHMD